MGFEASVSEPSLESLDESLEDPHESHDEPSSNWRCGWKMQQIFVFFLFMCSLSTVSSVHLTSGFFFSLRLEGLRWRMGDALVCVVVWVVLEVPWERVWDEACCAMIQKLNGLICRN